MSRREEVQAMKAAANEAFGPVGLLFANAGVTWFDRFSEMADHDIDWVMQVNLMGVLNCVHTFLPDMERARDGHVVATASNAGLIAGWVPDHAVYSAAKLGVVGMMLGLRQELEPVGVGTTVYCPGGVRGRIGESFALRPDHFGGPTDQTITLSAEWSTKNVVGFFEPEEVGPVVMQAVKENRPVVLDHSNQREHFMDWYAAPVIDAFDAAEEWERVHPRVR